MKTLLLIFSLFLVATDRQEMLEHGVSSVTGSTIVFHIGHQWFVDDEPDSNDVAACGDRLTFPALPPARTVIPAPLYAEPRQHPLAGNPIRAPPSILA